MNLNILAKEVSEAEGLEEEVNIAQIKEIIKVLFIILEENYPSWEILKAIEDTWDKYL